MNKNVVVFFFLIFLWSGLFGQKINGLIQDNYGNVLSNAAVTIKDIDNKTILFVFTDKFGVFQLQITEEMQPVSIIIKKYGYEESTEKFKLAKTQYNFILEKVTTLETINLVGKPPAIKVKKDTTIYKIEKFTDGTERKVQDVLKKLPGITVTEKGELEFKGKKVDKVLIDGDDFFNHNYTMGTKNISAKMLGSVEAIERYSENQVLRNLEDSDKVAINLKLKKGENDFSKTVTIGLGLKNKYLYDLNLIGVSFRFKTITSSNFNTIGINNTPYDFINNLYFDNPKEMDYSLSRKINLSLVYFDVKNNYLNQNQNFVNNINNLFKISKSATIGLNLSYTQDKIKIVNTQTDNYMMGNQNFSYNQVNEIIKKPKLFNTTINYLNNYKNSRIKIDGMYKNHNNTNELLSAINMLSGQNTLSSNENLLSLNALFSTALGSTNAIDFTTLITYYEGNENLAFGKSKTIESQNISSQNVFSNKSKIENNFTLLGKKNNFKYKLGIYHHTTSEHLISSMKVDYADYYKNNLFNSNLKWGLIAHFSYRFDNLLLSVENNIFTNRNYELQKNIFKLNPSFSAQYTLSTKSDLSLRYQIKSTELIINDLYSNLIFTDNYNLTHNISKHDFIDNQYFEVKYTYNNFLKNYLINLQANYHLKYKNLHTNFSFTEDYYLNTYFLDKTYFDNLFLKLNYQKLMQKLLSKVKTNLNYTVFNTQSKYFDVFQNNKIVFWEYSFSYLSIFNRNVNIGYDLKYTSNITNNFVKNSLLNEFTLLYKKDKKHLIKINNTLLFPDTQNFKNDILIINIEYYYQREKNSISFTINNITNTKYIYKNVLGENSTTLFSQEIMPIGCVLKYDF